jgi:uncharacterized protein YegP (UPF0339 family)
MYFEIVGVPGAYRARFVSSENHEIVWWTENYVHKAGAQHAIDLAKRFAASAPVYDRT